MDALTATWIVAGEEADLNKQLLFLKSGNTEPEKDETWRTPNGKTPVTVMDACPVKDKELGAMRSESGEKSKTVTFRGRVKLKIGSLPRCSSKCKVHA